MKPETKKKIREIILGVESEYNYGGNGPGLLFLLGPAALPVYCVLGLYEDWRDKRQKRREAREKEGKIVELTGEK